MLFYKWFLQGVRKKLQATPNNEGYLYLIGSLFKINITIIISYRHSHPVNMGVPRAPSPPYSNWSPLLRHTSGCLLYTAYYFTEYYCVMLYLQVHLRGYVNRLFAAITCSAMACPTVMCQVFHNIREAAAWKFPSKALHNF